MRKFVPIKADHFQAAAYRLESYTFDGREMRAHFGDGSSRLSVYATPEELLAAGEHDWRERVREVKPAIELPVRTVPPELLPLALDIQEARVKAGAEGSLRMRLVNVRTDERSIPGPEGAGAPTASRWRMEERRVR